MKSPSPEEIKAARKAAKITQAQAALLTHITVRGWQYWEKGDREMPSVAWELFLIKSRAV